jgi:hypothetical protein
MVVDRSVERQMHSSVSSGCNTLWLVSQNPSYGQWLLFQTC